MKDKWQMIFFGFLTSLFLLWAGWVSLTLISRAELIVVHESRMDRMEARQDRVETHYIPVIFKKIDVLEITKSDREKSGKERE